MDRHISELINICRDLNSEKGPERRKAAGKLKNVLNQNSARKALDKNHEYKQTTKNAGKIFTWECVFRAVCLYVTMETEDLQKANQEVSRTTLNNRETKKQEVSGLMKFAIRSSDKGSPKLKGSLLFNHIREVLHNDYMCASYGQDYCSILLKNVLSVRKYIVDLNTKEWHELLFLFFKLFSDPDVKIDKLVLARIISSLICGITTQCDVRPKKILAFFTDFFSKAKSQKSSVLLQHMLSALNMFVRVVGSSSRVQVCKLGEEIVPNLLYLWHNVAAEELKSELLKFLQTQMWCHHPSGVKQGCSGAYAVDWDKWRSNLRKLYELMYNEIQQTGPKSRTKECLLSPAFVTLAVDVCQQLFTESSHAIEVTQISSSSGDTQSGPGAKKRRLESGWEEIRNFIVSAGQTVKLVPWLQLVTGLISKYTSCIPRGEILPYLTCLSHALSDCKRTDLMIYMLRCIRSFVEGWYQLAGADTDTLADQARSIWSQVWMVALRFVSLHSGEPEGYMLLSSMIEKSLVIPRKDIWSLFIPTLTQPVTESIRFLTVYLSNCDLPENYVPNLVVSLPSATTDVQYPLRKQLIHWLLPSRDEEIEMSRSYCKLDPDWTATALMSLTLKEPSVARKKCVGCGKKDVSDLERQHIEVALVGELPMQDILVKKSTRTLDLETVHIATVLSEVEDCMGAEATYLCNRSEEQISDMLEYLSFTRLLARLIPLLLDNQILSPQTVTSSGLYTSLVKMLKKLSSSLQEIVKKEGYANLGPVIKEMQALFTMKKTEKDEGLCNDPLLASVLRAATPSRLVDLLLDIASDKHSTPRQTSNTSASSSLNQSRFSKGASRLIDDFDDEFDLEFEEPSNNNNVMAVDDLDFDDGGESQEFDETLASDGSHSLLSAALLTDTQTMRLAAVQTLCLWCSRDNDVTRKIQCETDVKYIKNKVISLLEDSVFDPNKAVDIQMLQHIVRELTETGQTLADSCLRTIIAAIRQCVKCHRRDQEVCRMNLDLLIRLVPHLADTDTLPSNELRECRDSVLHLASAFWKLQEKDYMSEVRLVIASLMETLLTTDPECTWSRFMDGGDEDSPSSQGESSPTPTSRFIDCVNDASHTVRIHVVSAVFKLFLNVNAPGKTPVDRDRQERNFSQLYTALSDSLDIQGKLSPERLEDERLTRVAGVLTALATVICSSQVSEKMAVFALLRFIKEKDIPVELVQTILEKVSLALGYSDSVKYLESYLPYYLHKWLQMGLQIMEFPHKLLDCDAPCQFYRKYLSVIIPELVSSQNLPAVEVVGNELGVTPKDLLRDSIPQTVVHILPVFAAGKQVSMLEDPGLKKKVAKATACYNMLTSELTEKVVERQIVDSLDDIVANLLMCLHDTQADETVIKDTNPEPNPPFYDTQTVTWTLDYITGSFSGSGKSLVEILSKSTDSIQNILLELSARLWQCHRVYEKRRTLFMYQLFVRQLLGKFHTQLGGAWAYVLRDVILRLVYLIRDMTASPIVEDTESSYRKNIASVALNLLREVCQTGIDACPKELMKYVPMLTSNLISVSELKGDVGELSLGLLKFLILENSKDLRAVIATLDNFPNRDVFKEFIAVHHKLKYAAGDFTLKQEIEHFLGASRENLVDPDLRLEGLKFIFEKLTACRHEILSLPQDDTLCRLTCELVQLTKCLNREVQLEAGRCLGVIGPVSLQAISLPSPVLNIGLQKALQCLQDIPAVHKYCKIFHCLNDYLTDKSIVLVQCASSVLKNLLSVKTGQEFSGGYKSQLGDNEYLFHYLHPFRLGKKKSVQIKLPAVSWDRFLSTVDQELLWNPQHGNHGNWVITLTTTLINSGAVRDEIMQLLEPVCSIKAEFCELVLPYLVHDVLVSGGDDHREVLSRQVSSFFSSHCVHSGSGRVSRCQMSNLLTDGDSSICMNVMSVRTMLEVIEYLRQQPRPNKGRKEMTPWDNNFWLDIDYLHVAMAAQYCSAHFSALLYAEIWCDVKRDQHESESGGQRSSQSLSQDTRMDSLSEASSSQSGVSVQDLLLEAYSWIGDPDGVYGCGAGRKVDISSRICTYQQENQWDKAMISCDIQMSQSTMSGQYDLLHALQCFGANHVFSGYLKGMMGQEDVTNWTSDTRELQYEAAWKMGQWGIQSSSKLAEMKGFHESVYQALKLIKEDHCALSDRALNTARICAMSQLKDGCIDSARRLYPVLSQLMCVNIVDHAAHLLRRDVSSIDVKVLECALDEDSDIDFRLPVLDMRISVTQLLWEKMKHKPMYNMYLESLLQLAASARDAGRQQISERAIVKLKDLAITDVSQSIQIQIEEARLFWARKEENIAKHLLRGTIEKLRKLLSTDKSAAMFYPQALSIYGNWLAETRSENPNIIMENYLEKAIKIFEKLGEEESRSVDAYMSLAKYADAQYQNIVNYMKSSTYEAKQSLMEKAKQEADRLREVMVESAKDRYLRTLEKQTEIDQHELEGMEGDRNLFLLKAVDSYIKCLRSGDEHNLRVFRLTSLWFNNTQNEHVNSMIQVAVSEIKTYKWLPLMYQLAARMDVRPHSDANQVFLDTLNKLIHATAVAHPHHTLFCVLALANANRDTELLQQAKSSRGRGSRLSKSQPDNPLEEGRVTAAKNMVSVLRDDKTVGSITRDLQTLCDAYIQLANWNVSEYKTQTKPIQLPSQLWLTKVKNLTNIPVPTKEIKVNASGDYKDIAYIKKFEPTFKLAGGINLPKIISCSGSDGSKNRQLVKGKDDLRQDAVMQQVFDMVNNLLQKNAETSKRQLQIRKYKVIPLSQRSGLLEWCEGTLPLGDYLIGGKGAHTRYRPNDWPSYDCRTKLSAASTIEEKFKTYQEICNNFRPVFRHFFLENFSSPSVWFERRLAYTRSVATNSIVGYILGLGDRHPQNILIDFRTAELVHIDLGIAFEQGRILPTPETVPFRLTRDIVDAMGASEVEGVFRRCCEKTMEVMRNNQESLLTILEVLLYDPLHVWTISPAKAYALQRRGRGDSGDTVDVANTTGDIMDLTDTTSTRYSETQENVNKVAERVLLRLHQKLQGVEDGVQLSLSGQVTYLIQEARNPQNLARIFPGWQPYI